MRQYDDEFIKKNKLPKLGDSSIFGEMGTLKEEILAMCKVHNLYPASQVIDVFAQRAKTYNGDKFKFIYSILNSLGFDLETNKKKEKERKTPSGVIVKPRNHERESLLKYAKKYGISEEEAQLRRFELQQKRIEKNKKELLDYSVKIVESDGSIVNFSCVKDLLEHLVITRKLTFYGANSNYHRAKKNGGLSNSGYSIIK